MATGLTMNNPFVWLSAGLLLAIIISVFGTLKGKFEATVDETQCSERRETCVKNIEEKLNHSTQTTTSQIAAIDHKLDQLVDLMKVMISQKGPNNNA